MRRRSTSLALGLGLALGLACGEESAPCGYTVSYDACEGSPIVGDPGCVDEACATGAVSPEVYAAWKASALEISGLSEAAWDERIEVRSVAEEGNFVRIEYVVVLGWLRSRQADSVELDRPLADAVRIAIEDAEWTGLAAITETPDEDAVLTAFDACACGIEIDWCHVDFENVSGRLLVRGRQVVDEANDLCRFAKVDTRTGELVDCDEGPCSVS